MMHVSTSAGYVVAIIFGIALNSDARLRPKKLLRIEALFDVGLSHLTTRFALVFIWWWLGWHFLGSLQPI